MNKIMVAVLVLGLWLASGCVGGMGMNMAGMGFASLDNASGIMGSLLGMMNGGMMGGATAGRWTMGGGMMGKGISIENTTSDLTPHLVN